ncbi:T6SS phospholipase effector Tle1-like catalytic domain-containing protein [Bradyrhizobium sp. CCBAU 53415]|uniref:T6SS phospholipase effector Tle1-like catalytic domain-containing protein n=1 Tax=Bradyrhizobium sp. CCBAU 53415 TaxID=1325119 RepID=UPI002305F9A8|nr:DUF2235 domain-containing protein [Bradyrhizobium sp. CCBAU 53415]MDA9463039.1 hypothetical protein [Bradyrhizobium sp. CCBAU 53415]
MSKMMIFLFDGTANDATEDRFSNVYALNQLIAESKRVGRSKLQTQVTFYLPGIGTKFTVRRAVQRGGGRWWRTDTVRQQIFGDNIEQIILRAYVNLCANYRLGDEIALVGFSRGAVAARIFSRLISDFGILTSDKLLHLDTLWNDFVEISSVEADTKYQEEISRLKVELRGQAGEEAFHPIGEHPILFLGLFDTVMGPLDELVTKNVRFRDKYPASGIKHIVHLLSMHDVREEFELQRFDRPVHLPETLREIWVPGVHSDVGGGYEEDFVSNISLLTMADLLEELANVALDPKAYKQVESSISSRIEAQRFFINKEPLVGRRRSRLALINADDEVHPLHWYLKDKLVYWKSSNPVKYEDRLNRSGDQVDPKLQKRLNHWTRRRRKPR